MQLTSYILFFQTITGFTLISKLGHKCTLSLLLFTWMLLILHSSISNRRFYFSKIISEHKTACRAILYNHCCWQKKQKCTKQKDKQVRNQSYSTKLNFLTYHNQTQRNHNSIVLTMQSEESTTMPYETEKTLSPPHHLHKQIPAAQPFAVQASRDKPGLKWMLQATVYVPY